MTECKHEAVDLLRALELGVVNDVLASDEDWVLVSMTSGVGCVDTAFSRLAGLNGIHLGAWWHDHMQASS